MLNTVVVLLAVVLSVSECSNVVNIDLGYEVNEDSLHWITDEPFTMEVRAKGYTEKGFWYESNRFCTAEHLGTHLDAPVHFSYGKWSVADIPLEHLIGQGVVVDIRDKVKDDPNAELTADDLMTWMNDHGPLPDKSIVFVLTGWGSRYGNKTAYFGTATNDTTKVTFPGINLGAAQLLTGYEKASGHRVFGVGLDGPSLDHGPSQTYPTHVEILSANIYGLENVANLEKLPSRGFEVIVMPIKITGGSGSTSRIIARVPTETNAAMTSSKPINYFFLALLGITAFLRLL